MTTASALRRDEPLAAPAPRRDGGGGGTTRSAARLATLGMWMALAPVAMLFVSFASAYIVRRGLGGDWVGVQMPALIWLNTLVLLASSVALEAARRAGSRGAADGGLLWATFSLGTLFLAGQVAAWVQLAGLGITVDSTPYGSFFYVLTGSHAVHLLGGVAVLLFLVTWPRHRWRRIPREAAVRVASIYWHFMGVLWLGILLLLVLGR